ncbi:MAG: phosphoglycerate kinase, partial [Planctomycetes bacterium]|nr:phosphoglycerate kinase [Planctomycetota bacterium]
MSSPKKTLASVDPAGRRAFVRVDFNVPLEGRRVGDDSRIQAALPTLRFILQGGGSAVVASRLGRPKGQAVEELRRAPVATPLAPRPGEEGAVETPP